MPEMSTPAFAERVAPLVDPRLVEALDVLGAIAGFLTWLEEGRFGLCGAGQ
jgi:hypothetical protein